LLGLIAGLSGMQSSRHNFSIHSGERQTGSTLAEIRRDHKLRYDFAIDYIKRKQSFEHRPFGLDLFCGNGYGTSMIASELQCIILGIDGSEEAVTFANSHFAHSGTYYTHKIFPFRLPRNTFDFITCYESLEHVQEDVYLLEQLNASLKYNGWLFLSTPNRCCLPLQKDFHKFHFKHYTMQEVTAMVNEVGEYRLATWLGQDLYQLNGAKSIGVLPDSQMELHERQEGQLLIYAFKKVKP
jgi:2-polyprenyl-3-methyl-5-hydroxy-6-metoxy-1,4-benzoquinol methylase